jgi:hypothetical protein
MKRMVAIFAIIFLLTVMVLPSASAASSDIAWSISPSQEYAIANGEDIGFKVNGMPGAYALVNIVDPAKHNATVENGMVFLNDQGIGRWNWSVPITQASGKFVVLVSMDGVNMTSTQIEIVYDRVSYLQYLVDQQTGKVERLTQMVVNYGQEVKEVKDLQFTMAIACVIVAVLFTTIALTLWWRREEFILYLHNRRKDKSSLRDRMLKIYVMFRRPGPQGSLEDFLPGLADNGKKYEKMVMKELGNVKPEPVVIIPDEAAPGGFIQYPLRMIDEEERKEDLEEKKELPSIEEMVPAKDDRIIINDVSKKGRLAFIGRMFRRRKGKDDEEEAQDEPRPKKRDRRHPAEELPQETLPITVDAEEDVWNVPAPEVRPVTNAANDDDTKKAEIKRLLNAANALMSSMDTPVAKPVDVRAEEVNPKAKAKRPAPKRAKKTEVSK